MSLVGPLVDLAMAVAFEAHAGQVDKGGRPYMLHPLRVMLDVGDDEVTRAAAVMHDVLEDTRLERSDLAALGFPTEVLDLLDTLTHRRGEPYESYIHRIAASPDRRAPEIKVADVNDNLWAARLNQLPPSDQERLRKKYERALEILQ